MVRAGYSVGLPMHSQWLVAAAGLLSWLAEPAGCAAAAFIALAATGSAKHSRFIATFLTLLAWTGVITPTKGGVSCCLSCWCW